MKRIMMKRTLVLSLLLSVMTANVFGNDGPDSDVSQMTNAMYIEPLTVAAGSEVELPICLKNASDIAGYSFFLKLPEGIMLKTNDRGRYVYTIEESRHDEHSATINYHNGYFKMLVSSLSGGEMTGNDGVVLTVTLCVDAGMQAGDYAVTFSEVHYSTPRGTDIAVGDTKFTLTVAGAADTRTVLSETSATAPAAATGVDVRVQRTIKGGEWGTICLPFAMTGEQVRAAFGDNVELGDFQGCETTTDDDENVTNIAVKFAKVEATTGMEANHPYIIKVSQDITEFTADNVDIVPEEEVSIDKDEYTVGKGKTKQTYYNSFVGTYVANTVVPDMTLFLSGNKFWYSTGNTQMKAFRGYFDFYDVLAEVDEAEAKVDLTFSETTTIMTARFAETDSGDVYNLQGAKVGASAGQLGSLPKGVYIRNHQKIVVK